MQTILEIILISAIMTGICIVTNISLLSAIDECIESGKSFFGLVLKDNEIAQGYVIMFCIIGIYFFSNMSSILLYLLTYGK